MLQTTRQCTPSSTPYPLHDADGSALVSSILPPTSFATFVPIDTFRVYDISIPESSAAAIVYLHQAERSFCDLAPDMRGTCPEAYYYALRCWSSTCGDTRYLTMLICACLRPAGQRFLLFTPYLSSSPPCAVLVGLVDFSYILLAHT